MQQDDIVKAFGIIRKRAWKILESDAPQVLSAAEQRMKLAKSQHDTRISRSDLQAEPWGYSIDPDRPLRFATVTVDGIRLRVDLIARVLWNADESQAESIDVTIRVWALQRHIAYRDQLDAPIINELFDNQLGRVMLQFHFDKANPGQTGPMYHMQMGGNPHGNKLSWFHPSIPVPRIPCPPMDLVLATQLIAMNFFPYEYEHMKKDPNWIGVIRKSQSEFWQPYFGLCSSVLGSGDSNNILLDRLLNDA